MKNKKKYPPGRIKIVNALRLLLEKDDFHSITTSQIAKTAGVTEGLIYKYFHDKKDLLYQVLKEHFEKFQATVEKDLEGMEGSVEKLHMIILSSLKSYAAYRVFARILLLEVRSSPVYFESEAYGLVRKYSRTILSVIKRGMETGEIAGDIDPHTLRQVILGSIEHACLREIIFGGDVSPEHLTDKICRIVFKGACQ